MKTLMAGGLPMGGAAAAQISRGSWFDSPMNWLRLAVAVAAVGLAAAAFRGEPSAVNTYLFMDLGRSHETAAMIERSAVGVVLLGALAGLVWLRWVLFLPAAVYVAGESIARFHVQGQAFADWVLLTQSARYLTPVALMLLVLGATRTGRAALRLTSTGEWILRVGLAAVFVMHGLEALWANPAFVDLIISSASNLTGIRVRELAAVHALEVIGCLDFLVAGAILTRPGKLVLGWAAFWALLTAVSRVTASGWMVYPEVLVRASYFLGPVALWLLVAQRKRNTGTRA